MCLCISVCARPSVCVQLCFKYMDIFSLNGEVHFLSWLYTSSVPSIQNINLNVLFFLSFQSLFIVLAVVDCYHRSAIRIFIATSLRVCVCVCVCVAYNSPYGQDSALYKYFNSFIYFFCVPIDRTSRWSKLMGKFPHLLCFQHLSSPVRFPNEFEVLVVVNCIN